MIIAFIKKHGRFKITTIAGIFFIIYLAWNLIYADKGLLTLKTKKDHVTQLTKELKTLNKKKIQLHRRVNLLYQQSLDLDLLEEQAVKILGYSNPKDFIILKDTKNNTLK